MDKNFILKDELITYLPNMGYGFITDMVTIEGKPVDYMVRQVPDKDKPADSGWVFYGGGETQDYLDNPDNISIMALNTIANYDPEIIPFLTYPYGTEIERNADGELTVINENIEEPDVVFMYPAEKGFVQITKSFGFEISERLLKRFDNGSLVLWKPEFTIWLSSYKTNKTMASQKETIVNNMSDDATSVKSEETENTEKLFYLLEETENGHTQKSANIRIWSDSDSVFMSIYYDSDDLLIEIDLIWNTIHLTLDN